MCARKQGFIRKYFINHQDTVWIEMCRASFRAFMANQLDEMGFKPSTADPDVWMRPAAKPDGEQYYKYILVYVDDIWQDGALK